MLPRMFTNIPIFYPYCTPLLSYPHFCVFWGRKRDVVYSGAKQQTIYFYKNLNLGEQNIFTGQQDRQEEFQGIRNIMLSQQIEIFSLLLQYFKIPMNQSYYDCFHTQFKGIEESMGEFMTKNESTEIILHISREEFIQKLALSEIRLLYMVYQVKKYIKSMKKILGKPLKPRREAKKSRKVSLTTTKDFQFDFNFFKQSVSTGNNRN